MNKTKIEWVKNPDGSPGYTFNPITGCLNGCPYCYARRLANGRLKQRYLMNTNLANGAKGGVTKLSINKQVAIEREGDYGNPFYPRFWPERLEELHQVMARMTSQGKIFSSSPKGIFVCDMGELFGDWIPKEWQEDVFECIKANSHHRFYILTKQPQNLIKFSPFPDNCWVGVTATEQYQFVRAVSELRFIEATIKYLSFEPLLAHIPMLPEALTLAGIKWVIIGAQTNPTVMPKIEWVQEIVEAADKAGIPIFLKDNLLELVNYVDKKTEFAFNKGKFIPTGEIVAREYDDAIEVIRGPAYECYYRQEMPK